MASELTYRGGASQGAEAAAAAGGGYSPKPSKPLAWLPRAARYAAGEHRPLFALAGMLVAAAIFSIATPSGSTPAAIHVLLVVRRRFLQPARPLLRRALRAPPAGTPVRRRQGAPGAEAEGAPRAGHRRRRVRWEPPRGPAGGARRKRDRGGQPLHGPKENVMHHFGNPNFEMIRHDVVEPILLEVDQIYHLACPASPVHYKYNPVKTIISFFTPTSHLSPLIRCISTVSCMDLDGFCSPA
ncbi:hypothetical protein GUJ93_ZPchr0010g9378 [Zizania palustris]|uniref:UDP-glucuronate decarboxylase n=1 Tax=Zizania palustris TaxID=103762 RepID=A0A8J5W9G2_ZIZPA|nr:hypothetical protein GUJ93_ZPchr0010g9378 [Zizania palustris]